MKDLVLKSYCNVCGYRTYQRVKRVKDEPNESLTYEWKCLSCLKSGIPYWEVGYWTRGFVPQKGEKYK